MLTAQALPCPEKKEPGSKKIDVQAVAKSHTAMPHGEGHSTLVKVQQNKNNVKGFCFVSQSFSLSIIYGLWSKK